MSKAKSRTCIVKLRQQEDPCVNVDLCQEIGTAEQIFSLDYREDCLPTERVQCWGSLSGLPTVSFQVTIPLPPPSLTVCWKIQFSLSNHTGQAISLTNIVATLKQLPSGAPLSNHTIPLPLNPVLANEKATTFFR